MRNHFGFVLGIGLIAACQNEVPLGYGVKSEPLGGLGQPPRANGTCDGALASCANVCVDLTIDPINCGFCGNACTGGGSCAARACVASSGTDGGPPPDPDGGPTPQPPEVLATATAPAVIVVDGSSVYWSERGTFSTTQTNGAIRKAPLAGGAVTTLASGLDNPAGLAVDAAEVYWVNAGHGEQGTYTNCSVMKTSVAGGPPTVLHSGLQKNCLALAKDGANLYWLSNGLLLNDPAPTIAGLYVMGLDGTGLNQVAHPGGNSAPHLAVTSAFLTWTGVGTLWSVEKNGAGLAAIGASTDASLPTDIATDGTSVFWTNSNTGFVLQMPAGGGSTISLSSGAEGQAVGIAIDTTHVYWLAYKSAATTSYALARVPKGGGATEILARGADRPGYLTVDATHVYWTTANSILRTPK